MTGNAGPLNELAAELSRIDPTFSYFALTLTATPTGELRMTTQTEFAGPGSKPMWEMRRASEVDARNMLGLWHDMGESAVVVNSEASLAVFLRIGGNAIIEKSIFSNWFGRLMEPEECVPSRVGEGVRSRESVEGHAMVKHAPTKKLRMDVLRRDNFRCRACGRSPDNYVDIELHVHHVLPWGQGGMTERSNLLTLCSTCHTGLDPHFEIRLLEKVPDGIIHPSVFEGIGDDFRAGVQHYRGLVADNAEGRRSKRAN
ncbi:HNH endonuclease signature motif containing protein [Mycobacterium sp. ITM-2016-00316]|uniref:HNH endonuclease n=1 Tax=Mycobacterium sp. ITM-2016-00316 TaxID=2099695 RepID=UPI001304834E|nr:HNH endonuclease signature motif containing protein [Mycobacterium sp. ITM-2016-00316]WNG79966.1 HNH endonuclease signature motif containing protein [Mycobacterium sp. ITM-2016-00316]